MHISLLLFRHVHSLSQLDRSLIPKKSSRTHLKCLAMSCCQPEAIYPLLPSLHESPPQAIALPRTLILLSLLSFFALCSGATRSTSELLYPCHNYCAHYSHPQYDEPALYENYNLLCFDARGHGDTIVEPLVDGAYTWSDVADDVYLASVSSYLIERA